MAKLSPRQQHEDDEQPGSTAGSEASGALSDDRVSRARRLSRWRRASVLERTLRDGGAHDAHLQAAGQFHLDLGVVLDLGDLARSQPARGHDLVRPGAARRSSPGAPFTFFCCGRISRKIHDHEDQDQGNELGEGFHGVNGPLLRCGGGRAAPPVKSRRTLMLCDSGSFGEGPSARIWVEAAGAQARSGGRALHVWVVQSCPP